MQQYHYAHAVFLIGFFSGVSLSWLVGDKGFSPADLTSSFLIVKHYFSSSSGKVNHIRCTSSKTPMEMDR